MKFLRLLGICGVRDVMVDEWTDGDASYLENFLISETGQKLMNNLRAAEMGTQAWACAPMTGDREWRAGVAFGMQTIRTQINKLSENKLEDIQRQEADEQIAIQDELNRRAGARPVPTHF